MPGHLWGASRCSRLEGGRFVGPPRTPPLPSAPCLDATSPAIRRGSVVVTSRSRTTPSTKSPGGERFPQDRELRRTGEMLGHPRDDVLRDDGHLPLALNFRCHVSVFLAEDGRRLHRHTPCVDGIRFDVPHPLKLSRRPNSSRLFPPISPYLRR